MQHSQIVPMIREADVDGKVVMVDLRDIASQLVSRAISQADIVIVSIQPTAVDAEIRYKALALIQEKADALGRKIKHVVLTETSAAVKNRVQKE